MSACITVKNEINMFKSKMRTEADYGFSLQQLIATEKMTTIIFLLDIILYQHDTRFLLDMAVHSAM